MNYFENNDWFIKLKCKQCCELLTIDMFYKHKEWFLWVLWRCKDCIKLWRKTDHELMMSRKRDKQRYHHNKTRREYVHIQSANRRINKWYGKIHLACSRQIKKLWIRPTVCSICDQYSNRIEAHHFNYALPWKVIFCCKICHSKLDRWIIDYKECKIVDIEPKDYQSKTRWIDHIINHTWNCHSS